MSSDERLVADTNEDGGHPHQTIVICQGIDSPEDVLTYGPFESPEWANGWIEQHSHDNMYDGEEQVTDEEQDRRLQDEDHYCNFGPDTQHYISGMWVPGFDPTTLPKEVK